MSAKGNKAKASKDAPKDPTPKRVLSAGRLPVRSPIDDGMRSQMFNLSPALSQRRRSNSPLLPGLTDPPPKKRKAKVSVEDPSASAADKSSSAEDKSSSAEDTPISASAADKSSSAEDMPLGIRLSEAVDQKLLQLSSRTPEKEHSFIEPSFTSTAKSSRTSLLGPRGDLEDEEETKSSPPLPALHAEDSQPNNQCGLVPASDRHKFKSFNLSLEGIGEPSGENFPRLEMNAKHGACVDTDDEDESSSPSSSSSNIAKIMTDTDAVSTAHKESTSIRSGGIPLDNAQWTSHLARNLAEGTRRTKSPPGTPQSHELEEERARLNVTQSSVPPSRIPLDLRLTEEELRRREASKSSSIPNVDDDLMDGAEFNAAAGRFNDNTRESSASAMPSVNSGASTTEDIALYTAFLSEKKAALSPTNSVQDMTVNDGEEQLLLPQERIRPIEPINIMAQEEFLKELEERSKLGLLDTLEDTRVAFRTILDMSDEQEVEDTCIPHSFTINLAYIYVLPTH
jgi:hypothetical protein